MSEGLPYVRVRDMLDCCLRIGQFTAGLDRDAFLATQMAYDAVLWNLAVLGEAADKTPRTVWDSHPDVPWADIKGARNRIVHGYGSINNEIVWEIVSRDIPDLIPQLRALLREADGQD